MITVLAFDNRESSEFTADPVYSYVKEDPTPDAILRHISEFADDDMAGILTGGRYFVRNEQPLTEHYIARIMESYDVILPFEAGDAFGPGLFIARCGVIRDFLSSVTDNGLRADTPEFAGLLKSYIIKHHLRVKCESTQRTDPEIWNAGYQKIRVIQGYFDAVLGEYATLRAEAGFDDSFAEADPYEGDFGGKTPVWICWWQGPDNAPEFIRACISSIERNLPDNACTVLITQNNYSEYVTLTPAICDKFARGLISVTHLSDILRAELLYRYGGMWIDATYYVSRPIPTELLAQDLYTLKFDPPLWGMDIQRGRWTLSLLIARKHHPAMQFMMEGLWLYWEQANELVDYFTIDYVCDAGYRHIDVIRDAFDRIEPAPPAVYDLQLMMNQRISWIGAERLASDSLFYKINRRNEYVAGTEHGFGTYYGCIIAGTGNASADDTAVVSSRVGGAPIEAPATITCASEGDLVRAIREVNPERIIDADGYYEAKGRISRGMLDDIILHPMEMILIADDSARLHSPVYDSVAAGIPEEAPVAEILMEDKYRLLCYD